jgi:hypothetical protein
MGNKFEFKNKGGSAAKPVVRTGGRFSFAELDDPTLLDYSQGQDGIPWIDNTYIVQLVDFEMADGHKFKGPKAYLLVHDVTEPDVRRTTIDGKVVKPANKGQEYPFYFEVNAPVVNDFDKGKKARQLVAQFACALGGFADVDAAKAAIAADEFSISGMLAELADMPADGIKAQELVCQLSVKIGKSGKGAFFCDFHFSPLPTE